MFDARLTQVDRFPYPVKDKADLFIEINSPIVTRQDPEANMLIALQFFQDSLHKGIASPLAIMLLEDVERVKLTCLG